MDTKCDEDGVPLFVQKIAYLYSGMLFRVRLFNGNVMVFCVGSVLPGVGLMDRPNERQMELAADIIGRRLEAGMFRNSLRWR